jgi:predicted nuclease of predicted toxin-antitoxin system
MKFKLDECVDARLSINLKQAGYDAVTARQQGLHGIEDERVYHLCINEGYILVTLDIHFSNVLNFDPKHTPGIVVLRGPDDLFATTRKLLETLIEGLKREEPEGKLWIVELERIRIHESMEEEG